MKKIIFVAPFLWRFHFAVTFENCKIQKISVVYLNKQIHEKTKNNITCITVIG